ncbi:MAG: transcriptional repressor LexA [Myxococcota bacterium]|nr:transcriptional repressor LexA [Myxococcota bacterium]
MQGLSERQRSILEYIHTRLTEDGVQPSYREIGNAMGIRSTNGVSDHIKALIRKGYLERLGGSGKSALARSLTLTDQARGEFGSANAAFEESGFDGEVIEIGVYGQVAAGALALAEEHREETLRVDTCMVPGGAKVFALRVYGESMIEDGILPGDYLFVQKQLTVPDGETAVVMVDGECTVKRFYREQDRIRLQPANSTMAPIYVEASEFRDVQIVGVVVGVYRRMH